MARSFDEIVGGIADALGRGVSAFVQTPGGLPSLGRKIVNGTMALIGLDNKGKSSDSKDPDPAAVIPDPSKDGHDNSTDLDNDQFNMNDQRQGSELGNTQDGKNTASGAQSSIMAVNTSTEATVEQQSSANAQNSVSQVLTAQSDADAHSQQSFAAEANGASVVVSPVLSISMDDSYSTEALSEYQPDDHTAAPNWLLVAAATAGVSYLAFKWFSDREE